MPQRPGVLFDVDGTLLDTNYLHTIAWSRALRDAGEWAPMHAIHRLVGMGGDQLVPRVLGHDNETARQRRKERFRELQDETVAFPRAADLLRAVHDAGLVVVLATSSPADELEANRERLGADEAIDAVTTHDDVSETKPAPDIFHTALASGAVDPHKALVVGDSVWDVEAARAAGLPCIGLESGGFSEAELLDAGAVAVYRDPADLLDRLEESPVAELAAADSETAGAARAT